MNDTLPNHGVPLRDFAFDVAGISEQGPRKENQDAFSADRLEDAGLVAVADGMGGERGGRLAAEVALRTLVEAAPIRSLDAARHAVRAADGAVARAAEEDPEERAGMGCAVAMLALADDGAGTAGWIAAHVGDVRILSRSPDGTLRLETRDHTPAYARWEAGEVALDAVPDTAGANRLQRAVGRGGEADAVWIPLRPGWRYLLISDGVSKAMRLDELGDALAAPSAAEACAIIARKVAERGPDDNYTAVVVRVSGEPEDRTPTPAPPLFNGAPPVSRPARTPSWLVALSLLNLLLLGALGWAAWSAWQTATSAAPSADLARVRAGMDSLRAEVDSLRAASADTLLDPFAPQNVGASPIPASPLVPNRR